MGMAEEAHERAARSRHACDERVWRLCGGWICSSRASVDRILHRCVNWRVVGQYRYLQSMSTWLMVCQYSFLCASAVFTNLGSRKEGQGSAYSVFNNFQHIEGELRMEQIEAEMMNRPLNRG